MKTFVLQRKVAAIFVGIVAGILIPSIVSAWPWSTDMMNQPSIKPQEGVMLPFPKRSIPVMGIPTKVKNRDESKALVNPVPPSKTSFRKGRQLYRIFDATSTEILQRFDNPSEFYIDNQIEKLDNGNVESALLMGGRNND